MSVWAKDFTLLTYSIRLTDRSQSDQEDKKFSLLRGPWVPLEME